MRDPSVDRSKASNLSPTSDLTLFYVDYGTKTYIKLVKPKFSSSNKGVLLENIGAVDTLTCSTDQILVNFADEASADTARSWPANTVLFTLADGCNADDERGVYVISKVAQSVQKRRYAQAARNAVTFTVLKRTLQEVADRLEISFGQLIDAANGNQVTSLTTTTTSYVASKATISASSTLSTSPAVLASSALLSSTGEIKPPVSLPSIGSVASSVSQVPVPLVPTQTESQKELEPGATESVMAEAITLPSPPLATLGPVSPPGVDMGGLGVLTPEPVNQLWFGGAADAMEDDESGAVTVRMTVDYKYPSIILDHSVYIKDVVCKGGSLQARFDNKVALGHSAEAWPAQVPLLFVTSATSCGNGEQNSFWLARTVTFDIKAKTFSAVGSTVELADVMNEMAIDFGKIEQTASPDKGPGLEETLGCSKPSSTLLGNLPAVPCGLAFDKTLDERIGYYAANGQDQQQVLSSIGFNTSSDTDVSNARNLTKRGWFSSIVKFVAKTVAVVAKVAVVVVQKTAAAIVSVVKTAATVAVVAAKTVVAIGIANVTNLVKLAAFVVTGNYDNSLTIPIDLGTGNGVTKDTPWEGTQGVKFYDYKPEREGKKWKASKINLSKLLPEFKILPGEANPEPGIELWCIDCGVKGKFVVTGSVSATPLSGLKKAQIAVNGNLYAGVFLGVKAFTEYENSIRKDLFVKGLPGWEIPKIVSLGPRAILAAQAKFSVEAEVGCCCSYVYFTSH